MKTRISLLLFTCAIVASCSKYHGHGPNNDFEPTAENAVYEGYFYYTHLTEEMKPIEMRIQELHDIINNQQATKETYEELKMQEESLNILLNERTNIRDISSIAGFEIGPLPPCPDRECVLPPAHLLRYLISETGTLISAKMIDEQENEVSSSVNSGNVPNTNNLFRYYEFENAEELTGNVTIFFERFDSNGNIITYQIYGHFKN